MTKEEYAIVQDMKAWIKDRAAAGAQVDRGATYVCWLINKLEALEIEQYKLRSKISERKADARHALAKDSK